MNQARPVNPGFIGSLGFKAKLIGFASVVLLHFGITEWVAWAFLRENVLPEATSAKPWGFPFYQPFAWVMWVVHGWAWLAQAALGLLPQKLIDGTPSRILEKVAFLRGPAPSFAKALWIAIPLGIFGTWLVLKYVPGAAMMLLAYRYSGGLGYVKGDARWAETSDLKSARLLRPKPGGINLGIWAPKGGTTGPYIRDASVEHVMLAAPTGSGKSQAIVLTLQEWQDSALILDMKGELWDMTAGYRASLGHNCIRFAPADPENSARYNPIDFIRMGEREVADCKNLASVLAFSGGEGPQDSKWSGYAAELIALAIMHELYRCQKEFKRTATMNDVANCLSPLGNFQDHLKAIAVYKHDPEAKQGWKDAAGQPTKTHPMVRRLAIAQLNKSNEFAGSVLGTATSRLDVFLDPLVNTVTSTSDFAIRDLVSNKKDGRSRRPTSLYFVIPDSDVKRLSTISRLLVAIIRSTLMEKKREPGQYDLLLLLDEFPALGRMEPLETCLARCRSYGMRFMLIVQDFGQVQDLYGIKNSIEPNCRVRMIFATSDLTTAKSVSESIGSETIEHASLSFSGEPTLLPVGKGISAQVHQVQKMLLDPSQVGRLRLPQLGDDEKTVTVPGEVVIIKAGFPPVRAVQGFWFFDREAKKRVGIPPPPQQKWLPAPAPAPVVIDATPAEPTKDAGKVKVTRTSEQRREQSVRLKV